MEKKELAQKIDHTLLKAEATPESIARLCTEALDHAFFSVCVNPCYVPLAANILQGSGVNVCTVVGFPLGATYGAVKVFEAGQAVAAGAVEIDMVINLGALKAGEQGLVFKEIEAVVQQVKPHAAVKVILETCFLERDQIILGCQLATAAGADFVKTSTGFGSGGATIADVTLLKESSGPLVQVKASGGIKSLSSALAMLAAGANRLGTSSGIQIMQELESSTGKG